MEDKECFKNFIKENISKRFRERGLKVEDYVGEFKVSLFPSFVIKSGSVNMGYVFIVLDDQDLLGVRELKEFKEQFYIVVEKGKEKQLTSLLIDLGIAGRVRLIPWEFKVYF